MDGKSRKGIIFNKLINAENVINPDFLYKPRKGDVIAVGPVKSGTTWMQQILHQIRSKGDENFDDIYTVTQFITNPKNQLWDTNVNREQAYSPRVFKQHEEFGVIPTSQDQKHVVIVRDPYDAAYSWLKFTSRWYGEDVDVDDADSATTFEDLNKHDTCPSFKCISSWYQHRNDDNVLFLFYEDLLKDLKSVIRKIANFIEVPLSDEELCRVTYLCTHEYMTKHKEQFQGDVIVNYLSMWAELEKWKPQIGMVREDGGKVGQGARNIGPKLKEVVDKLWKEHVENVHGFKTYADMYEANSLFRID